jgi:hypothetical protein
VITGDSLTINVVKSSSLINTQNPIHSSISCISSNISLKNAKNSMVHHSNSKRSIRKSDQSSLRSFRHSISIKSKKNSSQESITSSSDTIYISKVHYNQSNLCLLENSEVSNEMFKNEEESLLQHVPNNDNQLAKQLGSSSNSQ